MFGLEVLDLALGMIFIYLLLSLICTAINELIESFLKLRSVDLEQGIREILQDYDGNGLAKQFYDHPIIFSLFRDTYDPEKIRNRGSSNNKKKRYTRGTGLPSYIPAKTFSFAMLDVLAKSNVPVQGGTANAEPPDPMAALRNGIMNNPALQSNPRLQQVVLSVANASGGEVSKVREIIEGWYNSSMDRVSGWYTRRVKRIIFVMGFILAIAMNADSIAIFNSLANDKPVRNAVVAQATAFHENHPDSVPPTELRTSTESLKKLGLPIGWGWRSDLNHKAEISNLKAVPPAGFYSWLVKILGWLATALAISLGAPFWFDMLNKIMVVRATVKPAEKSPEEGSEDRRRK